MADTMNKTLGDKLEPCPFCKRKMVFYRHTYKNKLGKDVTEQYYLHEDTSPDKKCILDEIMMPFCIGAGDADETTGKIGEYAELWNKQLRETQNIS